MINLTDMRSYCRFGGSRVTKRRVKKHRVSPTFKQLSVHLEGRTPKGHFHPGAPQSQAVGVPRSEGKDPLCSWRDRGQGRGLQQTARVRWTGGGTVPVTGCSKDSMEGRKGKRREGRRRVSTGIHAEFPLCRLWAPQSPFSSDNPFPSGTSPSPTDTHKLWNPQISSQPSYFHRGSWLSRHPALSQGHNQPPWLIPLRGSSGGPGRESIYSAAKGPRASLPLGWATPGEHLSLSEPWPK